MLNRPVDIDPPDIRTERMESRRRADKELQCGKSPEHETPGRSRSVERKKDDNAKGEKVKAPQEDEEGAALDSRTCFMLIHIWIRKVRYLIELYHLLDIDA